MELIGWSLLGALIGVAAAQKKGFSVAGGIIGGLLLGPFAILMFLVSGISKDDKRKKCPFCAEFVKAEAIVCMHCKRDLPAPQPVAVAPAAPLRDPSKPPEGWKPKSKAVSP